MTVIEEAARAAREAARSLATLATETKNHVLVEIADALVEQRGVLLEANGEDLAAARAAGLSGPKLQRLALTDQTLAQMATGLRQVAELSDPVGAVTREYTVPSGLRVRKVRAPLGVIAMIYESRPNVTIDAFALCFKAGNACLLKGGQEADRSNATLADWVRRVLVAHNVPQATMTSIVSSDREALKRLLKLEAYIDLVIPRGGEALIRFVHEHSRIPMVQHFNGVCHIFVDASADLEQALKVCTTAKTSAPAACNAVETVLVHEAVAPTFVERVQSSCTLVNASTRFNDGFQLGLGAEIGISTSKIHAYGPMGLEELTTQRYVVFGHGQCR